MANFIEAPTKLTATNVRGTMDHIAWVVREVQEATRRGISVSIDGKMYDFKSPEEVFGVLEEANYMPDYIGNEEGKIVQICFDKINE